VCVNSVELHIPLFKIVDGDVVDGLILFHNLSPGCARRYCASYESCDDTTDKDGCTLLCVVTPVLFHVALGFRLDAFDRGLDACFDCLLLKVLLCGLEWVTHLTSSSLVCVLTMLGLAVSRLSKYGLVLSSRFGYSSIFGGYHQLFLFVHVFVDS